MGANGHESITAEKSITHLLAIAGDLGVPLRPGLRVLDLGCGWGHTVAALLGRGYDAWGVDIQANWVTLRNQRAPVTPDVEARLRIAELTPYRLPFDDEAFDLVLSQQVFEHVMDYEATLREVARVLARDGIAVNQFPSRWQPREQHVHIPLANVFRPRPYLAFWAFLGLRNEYQQGLTWREVVDRNVAYLRDRTNYPTNRAIRRFARRAGVEIDFAPELWVKHHPGRNGRIVRMATAPFPRWLARLGAAAFAAISQRIMVVRRNGARRDP
jgi:SAM-dependent methyltransferase